MNPIDSSRWKLKPGTSPAPQPGTSTSSPSSASDPFASSVSLDEAFAEPEWQPLEHHSVTTFDQTVDSLYTVVSCDVCATVAHISNPVPVLPEETRLSASPPQWTAEERSVHRVRAQLPGWTIPMIALDAIECSACTEPPY